MASGMLRELYAPLPPPTAQELLAALTGICIVSAFMRTWHCHQCYCVIDVMLYCLVMIAEPSL